MLRRLPAVLLGLAVIALLLVGNHFVFARWLDASYLRWYVAAGPWIGIGTTLMMRVWPDLEQDHGLISAHPLAYVGSWLQIAGATILSFAERQLARPRARSVGELADRMLCMLFMLGVCVGLTCWLLVVMPAQYAVYVLCGSPSRGFRDLPQAPVMHRDGPRTVVSMATADGALPYGWFRDGLASKPLSVTATFATVLLLLVRGVVS